MHRRSENQSGFTLIELMITVAIIAILAAVAFPAYTKYVQRSNRSEGIAQLNDAAARMERYYAQNNSYNVGNDLSKIGLTAASPTGRYALSIASTATSYTLTSAPQGPQASDTCGTLTLDQAGAKNPTTADCWK